MNNPKTRSEEWEIFSNLVKSHIEKYAKNQYNDKGTDPITNWSFDQCMDQIKKYYDRKDSNERVGENYRDLLKIAHYACISYFKLIENGKKDEKFFLTKDEKNFIIDNIEDVYKKTNSTVFKKILDILKK